MTGPAEQIVQGLGASKKYRHICDETMMRIAVWAMARYPSPNAAAKAARRKLHQSFAAYCMDGDLEHLAERVACLPDPANLEAFQAACGELLSGHASTAERRAFMGELYARLWREVGMPRVLLDLACGYHPFALPWMQLDASTTYHGCDIDKRLVAAANAFLARLGRPENVACKDILVRMPNCPADVALLLKTLPCLEQQEKGIGPRLLRGIPARHIVVSFPVVSLGGRAKGMRTAYDRRMAEIVDELRVPVRKLNFPNEDFYVLTMESS